MAIITLPSKVLFDSVDKLQLLRGGVSLRSKYTGKRQAISFPFALWVLEGKLIPMEGLDAGEWRAFLASLNGEENTFQLPVPGVTAPLSGYSGIPVTTAASVAPRSKSMAVAGTPGAKVVEKGDYFTVNQELKLATAPCTLDGTGAGTIQFEPGMRGNMVSTGVPLHLNDPFCVMSAQDVDAATWSLERPVRHGITLKAIEAF